MASEWGFDGFDMAGLKLTWGFDGLGMGSGSGRSGCHGFLMGF